MSALWLSAGGRPTEYISIERNDLIKIKEYFNLVIGTIGGLSNQEIAQITGHKDAASVDRYDRPSDSRKHRLTSALSLPSCSADQKEQTIEQKRNVTISKPGEMNEIVNALTNSSGNNIQIFSNCTVYLKS